MTSTASEVAILLAKAQRACSSARVLLEIGDLDGAANRAYYAMFDSARAALVASGVARQSDSGRTHGGLIGAFGRHMVKTGKVPVEMGRLLNRAHEIRLVADYTGDCMEPAEAAGLVAQADTFVALMCEQVLQGKREPEPDDAP